MNQHDISKQTENESNLLRGINFDTVVQAFRSWWSFAIILPDLFNIFFEVLESHLRSISYKWYKLT